MNNSTTNSVLPLTGRILMSAIFILSGVGKLAAPAATMGYISAMGLPFPAIGLAGAVAIELLGGLMLAFGWQTRAVAWVLAGFSIVTGLIFHHAIADQNQMIHLLKNFAMAGGLLHIAAFGAGAVSIDARRARRLAAGHA
ncbi:MAG: DoxX family protein [Massilia sp.]